MSPQPAGTDFNGVLQSVYDPATNALRVSGSGASGAPTDAHYITTQSESGLSAETVWGTAGFYPPDVVANRPSAAATIPGAIFYATDTGLLYRSDGSSTWTTITSVGGGSADKLGLTPTAVKTTGYTASAGDFVPCDIQTTASFTLTFPTAPADGSVIACKVIKTSAGRSLTLQLGGSDVFNVAGGAQSGSLSLLNQAAVFQYKSSSAIWYTIATDIPLSGMDARYLQITNNLSDLGTRQTALNNIAGAVTNNQVLAGDGANVTLRALAAADIPNLDTSKLTTGTLGVARGGTGAGTLTGLVLGNGTSAFTTVTAPSGTVVGTTDTQTLTNKNVTQRITSIASSATPTINTDSCDAVTITALAVAITSMTTNLSGSPTDFERLIFRIKDNGTARAITWGASFAARGVSLPTTTVISKVLYVGFVWNAAASTWDCIASAQEA